jgi:MarR family 2-MHQ and catechol resistance regulon transcriptional repressor
MGTHHRGPPDEIRALDAFIKLSRAKASVDARLNRLFPKYKLTESQFGTLEALLHLGPLCQTSLAGKLLTSGANVTTVVDNLEKRGLVQRVRSTEDRRFVRVHLTDAGRALIAEIFPLHARSIADAFTALSPAELEAFSSLCKKLGQAVTDAPAHAHLPPPAQ